MWGPKKSPASRDAVGQSPPASDHVQTVPSAEPSLTGTHARQTGRARAIAVAGLAVAATFLLGGATASAKLFRAGEIEVCSHSHCAPVTGHATLARLAAYYYDATRPPRRAAAPPTGAPYWGIQFRDGYVTGIVAGRDLGTFLSYGVNLGQFTDGVWYRVPPAVAAGLRRAARGVAPARLAPAALAGSDPLAPDGPPAGASVTRATAPAAPDGSGGPAWTLSLIPLAALLMLAFAITHHHPHGPGGTHGLSPR